MCFKHLVHTFFLQLSARTSQESAVLRCGCARRQITPHPMNSLNPPASGPRNARPPGTAFRLRRPAPLHPYRPALSIEVLVGVAPRGEETAVLPLILRGIHERAQLEMRERPEIGRVRITVRPAAAEPKGREAEHPRRRHGVILIFSFEGAALERHARADRAVAVLGGEDLPGLDLVEADD